MASIPTGSLLSRLTRIVGDAFAASGADPALGRVVVSNRPDLCDVQSNGAFAAAKALQKAPPEFANEVAERLRGNAAFRDVSVAGAYLNMTLSDALLMEESGERLEAIRAESPLKIIIDYGGANVAKPLHVGHLRSAIIGESLKRICRSLGHEVIGDVHLGDWGLQMGMILHELSLRQPGLPYFAPGATGPFPEEAPVTLDELDELYPSASAKSKSDPEFLAASRQATALLQQGHPGYRALWQNIVNLSVSDLRVDYGTLDVFFDLWYGESTVNDLLAPMVQKIIDDGFAYESNGALVVDVAEASDKSEIPPLILQKSDGAVLYSTTDLATIVLRVKETNPDLILYVIDKRQSLHLVQVYRAAWKTGIAPRTLQMEHIGFGTMNGTDGKPFKTRAGGTMKLKDLIQLVTERASARIAEAEVAQDLSESERAEIARMVGIATLKFADLSNTRIKDYVFDVDRFSSFEGRTGPYLLYTAVRAKSILRKAAERGFTAGALIAPRDEVERNVLLSLALLRDRVLAAFASRGPNEIADYAYDLASLFARYYHEHHILREEDEAVRASSLELVQRAVTTLELALDLLGIEVPERM
ncbi:MAG TPA: arginine--tRNA ligase [Thermoanaerobaculia bacterium]|nr:arginine--tRNA ligase [Thermoanaerobaculia bacterium]